MVGVTRNISKVVVVFPHCAQNNCYFICANVDISSNGADINKRFPQFYEQNPMKCVLCKISVSSTFIHIYKEQTHTYPNVDTHTHIQNCTYQIWRENLVKSTAVLMRTCLLLCPLVRSLSLVAFIYHRPVFSPSPWTRASWFIGHKHNGRRHSPKASEITTHGTAWIKSDQ